MAKYCASCGTKLDDDALFCEKCGRKTEMEEPVAEPVTNHVVKPVKKHNLFKEAEQKQIPIQTIEIAEAEKENSQNKEIDAETGSINKKDNKQNNQKTIIGVMSVIIVALVICMIAFVFPADRENEKEKDSSSSSSSEISESEDSLVVEKESEKDNSSSNPSEISESDNSSTAKNDGNENDENTPTQVHTHSFGSWNNAGTSSHTRTCSCGAIETENHIFDSGKVTKEPTETSDGIKTFTCIVCGATRNETIANLQHTHNFGSWTDDGNDSTHSKTCSCGDTKYESHSWSSWEKYDGEQHRYCTQCGASQIEADKTTTRNFDYECICNYCGHNDGMLTLVLENGVKVDVIWNCSSCGRENWNYVTYTW